MTDSTYVGVRGGLFVVCKSFAMVAFTFGTRPVGVFKVSASILFLIAQTPRMQGFVGVDSSVVALLAKANGRIGRFGFRGSGVGSLGGCSTPSSS